MTLLKWTEELWQPAISNRAGARTYTADLSCKVMRLSMSRCWGEGGDLKHPLPRSVSTSTSSGSFLAPLQRLFHHTTGTPCKLTFLSSCLPCPQVFQHNNNLNEIMREIHSNAVEGAVLLLRQQRELIESTGKEAVEGEKDSEVT